MLKSRMPGALFALLMIPCVIPSCTQNNVTIDNTLGKYFDSAGLSGSFGLFDNTQGHFTIYNLPRYRDSVYLPGGTFDIVSSLVGIQTGIVKDDSAFVKGRDLIDDTVPILMLREAFQRSDGTIFGALVSRIGKDTMKRWVDSLGYGNKDISGPIDSFWMNDRLRITADEELGLIKKLYFDQLPFFQRTQRIVRNMMLKEDNANYRLSFVTGTGRTKDGLSVGWIVGWIEENKHTYFFVLNAGSADAATDMEKAGTGIFQAIMKQLGFFEGKK